MEGTPGTPAAESAIDVVAAATDAQGIEQTEGLTPTAGTDAVEAAAGDGDTGTPGEGADDAAAADEADLAQYPEAVRESFKALQPAQRKALYEQAEARIEEKIRAERERNDKLEADRRAAEQRRAEIRAKAGRFVGLEGQTITAPDGTERTLPSYEELAQLSQTRRGRDVLYEKYRLDEDAAEELRSEWDARHEMIQAVSADLDDQAWGKLDASLRDGIRAEGLDPDAVISGAQNPHDVLRQFAATLRAEHAAEVKKLTEDYEGRLSLAAKNAEGLRGRAVAGSTRQPATGGRSGGSAAQSVTDRLIEEAGGLEAWIERAKRGDYANVDLTRQ